jgi:Zn-dependent M28 family amino/carboxypeptidase
MKETLLTKLSAVKAAAILLVACLPYATAASVSMNIVNGISQDSYTHYLSDPSFLYTHDGDNRGIGAEQHDLAQASIENALLSFGLTTVLQSFVYGGSTYYNIVATKPGALRPNDIYIVGAHYDSVNNPGADDDASGVAGVLEAARVLSQYQFADTLVFAAFDREEQGMIGSYSYVLQHSTDHILGMLELDMIAYDDGSHSGSVNCSSSPGLQSTLVNDLAIYGGLSATTGAETGSDHHYFETSGFSACLLIENAQRANPNYHTSRDSVDTSNYINYGFGTQMTRTAAGWLADSADPIPEPRTSLPMACAVIAVLYVVRRRRVLPVER